MKTIEIKQKLVEEALDQLKAAQQDSYVQSTQNVIDELELALRQPHVSGSLLKSLHQDLKGFQEMAFLTPDVKTGLGIAIEQVERYMRNELEARQQ